MEYISRENLDYKLVSHVEQEIIEIGIEKL